MTADSADRLLTTQRIMAEFPDQPVIMTGGANPFLGGKGEAELVEAFLNATSNGKTEIYFENQARNTAQNATKTLELLEKELPELQAKPWRLVTSAFHMKRSLAIFKRAGFDIVPVPTDFRSEVLAGSSKRGYKSIALGLKDTDIIFKEHVGYFVYWMTGRL